MTSFKVSKVVKDRLSRYRDELEKHNLGRISLNESLAVLLDKSGVE